MKRVSSIVARVNVYVGLFFLGAAISRAFRADWHYALQFSGFALFFFWYAAYAIPQMKRWLNLK